MAQRADATAPGPGSPTQDRQPVDDDEITVVTEVWDRAKQSLHLVDLTAGLVILAQLGAALILLVPGSLYADDLVGQGAAFGHSLADYVRSGAAGGPAALPRVLQWLLADGAPLDHTPVVLITLGVRLAFGVVAWALLRQLFGPRALALVPLGLLLLSPALVPATARFTLTVSGLVCTTALLWALDAELRWLTRPRARHLLQVGLASALAVLSDPRGAAAPVLLLVAALALFGSPSRAGFGPAAGGWMSTLRQASPPVFTSAVSWMAVLAWYNPPVDGSGRGLGLGGTLELALRATFRTALPAVFGGPWSWTYPTRYYGLADAGVVLVALVCLVAGAGVARWAVLRPSETGRALVLGLGWLVPAFVLVGRQSPPFNAVGDLALDLGRWPDVATVLLLCGALCAIPWRIGACKADRPVFDPHLGEWLIVTHLDDGPTGPRRPTGLPVLVGLLVAVLASVLSIGSWSSFAGRWWENPTGTYLAFTVDSLRGAEVYPRIAPQPLPEAVLPQPYPVYLPWDAPLVGLIRPDARFADGDGPVRAVDIHGTLQRARPVTIAQSPVGGCPGSTAAPGSQARVPLLAAARSVPGALVEVGALVQRSSTLEIQVEAAGGRQLSPVRWSDDVLPAGPHTLRVPMPPGIVATAVLVRTPTSPATCVTQARIVRMTTEDAS